MYEFGLYIYKNGQKFNEMLNGPSYPLKSCLIENLPLFAVTNALLKSWSDTEQPSLSNFEGNAVLERFTYQFYNKEEIFALRRSKIEQEASWDEMSQVEKLASVHLDYMYTNFKHFEEPVKFNAIFEQDAFDENFYYWIELISIERAIKGWLVPTGVGRSGRVNRKTPSQKYAEQFVSLDLPMYTEGTLRLMAKRTKSNPDIKDKLAVHNYIFLQEARKKRNLQFTTELCAININKTSSEKGGYKLVREKPITSELFISSKGLLPLVWAEILFAVRNNIFANFCGQCGNLFAIPLLKGQKYCSPQCAKEADRIKRKIRHANSKKEG